MAARTDRHPAARCLAGNVVNETRNQRASCSHPSVAQPASEDPPNSASNRAPRARGWPPGSRHLLTVLGPPDRLCTDPGWVYRGGRAAAKLRKISPQRRSLGGRVGVLLPIVMRTCNHRGVACLGSVRLHKRRREAVAVGVTDHVWVFGRVCRALGCHVRCSADLATGGEGYDYSVGRSIRPALR